MRTQSGTGSFSATTYDAAGSYLGSVTFSLTEAATWYAIVDKLPAGTYYVRIDDYNSTQATYELKVDSSVLSTVRENEPNNSKQDADRLTLGQSFSAALTTNDDLSDYFKFSIGSAQVLSLDLLTPTANKATYFYEITDAKSNRLGSGSTISEASLSFNAASAGDYFLRVYGNAGTVFQGDYSV
ncbi:MAG: hypothetical protein EB072_19045, partial [Betaproteobacteria bacterium]|nr:hypothetical protein [Betaproteobacteria bacterium]